MHMLGMSGFHFRGGGPIEPPPKKNWVEVREKGSIDKHH